MQHTFARCMESDPSVGKEVTCVGVVNMGKMFRFLVFLYCIKIAALTEPACVIELSCAECVPDNMPLVTSHRAANLSIVVPAGEELRLSCGRGRLLVAPLRPALAAVCEAGLYRLPDGSLRHLLELGCQESIFEDVLHDVSGTLRGGARHVATLCFDADRALAAAAHATNAPANTLRLAPHSDRGGPLSLLGNFNHMFDATTRGVAERLYADDASANRRLRELLKHDRAALGDQTLTAGRLLSERYFEDQIVRVADFASNKVAVWRSVAAGNLRHAQLDVARLLKLSRPAGALHVHAGTHGVASVRGARGSTPLYLRAGGRFPAPRYVWTVVLDTERKRGLAVVVLNDPLVAVSEIRASVFCESVCARVQWAHELRRARRFETPLLGLAFCCALHDFADDVPEFPRALLAAIPRGDEGLLTELYTVS